MVICRRFLNTSWAATKPGWARIRSRFGPLLASSTRCSRCSQSCADSLTLALAKGKGKREKAEDRRQKVQGKRENGDHLIRKSVRLGFLLLLCSTGAWISSTGEFESLPGQQRLAAQGRRPERTASGPLSPAQALAGFELEPGYRIEVAAAEPV